MDDNRPAGSASSFLAAIATLNIFCFRGGVVRYKEVYGVDLSGHKDLSLLTHDEQRNFMQCVNYSLTVAEGLIIDLRKKIEAERRLGTFVQEGPYSFGLWMAVLTDYADTIGWMMLNGDLSAVRSQFLDTHGHSDLNQHNWESVEEALAILTADPDLVALATDLTSFLNVGDVLVRNTVSGEITSIELKEGEVNGRVIHVLDAGDPEEFEKRVKEHLREVAKPDQFMKQLSRTIRQSQRAAHAGEYSKSDGRTRRDLKTGNEVGVFESDLEQPFWYPEVRAILADLKTGEAAGDIIESCLYFEYAKSPHSKKRAEDFAISASSAFGVDTRKVVVWDVVQLLASPGFMPQSTSLLSLGEESQTNLLLLRHSLLVALSIDRLRDELARTDVILAVRKMKQGDHELRSPLTTRLIGANKVLSVSSAKYPDFEIGIGDGLLGRVLFNFLTPKHIGVIPDLNLLEGNWIDGRKSQIQKEAAN
jgi:hypothetical protein